MNNVRILRPDECKHLVNCIPKHNYQIMFKALLYSGARYVELKRFHKHHEWFDGDFIHLPKFAMKKKKRKQLERWVRLNPAGKEIIKSFLQIKQTLLIIQLGDKT